MTILTEVAPALDFNILTCRVSSERAGPSLVMDGHPGHGLRRLRREGRDPGPGDGLPRVGAAVVLDNGPSPAVRGR